MRPDFLVWLRAQARRDDPVGDVARDYIHDPCSPQSGGSAALVSHMRGRHRAGCDAINAARQARWEWWRAPMRDEAEAREAVAVAQARYPDLGANGFRAPSDRDFRLSEVATSLAFLRQLVPIKTGRFDSYFLKHAAEQWGERHGLDSYVCNGALIMAAVYLGLVVEPYSLNAGIGVSKRSLRAVLADTRLKDCV